MTDPRLNPDSLRAMAIVHFSNWDIATAYGCARLASFISRQYISEYEFQSLQNACQSFYYVRHRLSHAILLDILERDIIPDLSKVASIPIQLAAEILNEFADLFSDHGEPDPANQIYELVLGLGKMAQLSPHRPHRYASRLRKSALTKGILFADLDASLSKLAEAEKAAPTWDNLRVSIANVKAWLYLEHRNYRKAHDCLEPLFHNYRKELLNPTGEITLVNVCAWNMADLCRNYALTVALLKSKRLRRRVHAALETADKLFRASGTKPMIPYPSFWREVLRDLPDIDQLPRRIVGLSRPHLPYKLRNRAVEAINLVRKMLMV